MKRIALIMLVFVFGGCASTYSVSIDMRVHGETDLMSWMILSNGASEYEYEVSVVPDPLSGCERTMVFECEGQQGNMHCLGPTPMKRKVFMGGWLTDPLDIDSEYAFILRSFWIH